jgi:hypothetical protein
MTVLNFTRKLDIYYASLPAVCEQQLRIRYVHQSESCNNSDQVKRILFKFVIKVLAEFYGKLEYKNVDLHDGAMKPVYVVHVGSAQT